MTIRDEDLVQYLLGEADSALRSRVEQALQTDHSVVSRLEELRAALGLLDSIKSVSQPPDDLVARTMLKIEESLNDHPEPDASSPNPALNPVNPSHPGSRPFVRLRRSEFAHAGARTGRTPWDSAMLTVSIVALTCLLLPLVLEARSRSRRLACESNQRQLGRALTQLAQLDPEHRFPSVPGSGPEAFAGIYAVKLQDRGLLDSSSWLRCASLPGTNASRGPVDEMLVPTTTMFNGSTLQQQSLWRARVGGDYAYNFGVVDGERIVGPRLEGRSHLAILADAPRVEGDRDVFNAHDGRGINIYYEDGHVAFFCFPRAMLADSSGLAESGSVVMVNGWHAADYPFRNLEGRQAYGLSPSDAALGPSDAAPLPATLEIDSSELRKNQ